MPLNIHKEPLMSVPLDYTQRVALLKAGTSRPHDARSHATATYERLMTQLAAKAAPRHGPVTKQTVTSATPVWDEMRCLAESYLHTGQVPDIMRGLERVATEQPALYQRYIAERRHPQAVDKALSARPDTPATVQVTHPQGVQKDQGGVPLPWEAQVAYWQAHPDAYTRYRRHFATAPPTRA